jgi:hypothetical protein
VELSVVSLEQTYNRDMLSLPRWIPVCISASLGYLHIHLTQSSAGSISLGVFTPAGAFYSPPLAGGHAADDQRR